MMFDIPKLLNVLEALKAFAKPDGGPSRAYLSSLSSRQVRETEIKAKLFEM